MTVYYNENDKQKAAWLRELIRENIIAPGEVDERSVKEVQPEDLAEFAQCHFFAGIGVWSYALRLAGWPDDRPVWTGSCPCPSFSSAGKGGGFDDPRHLWPDWVRLIRERRPATVFGEQVDDAIGYGWLDVVQTDLEGADYSLGKAVLGACSVGAPHIRQRLYFVAESAIARREKKRQYATGSPLLPPRSEQCCGDGGMAHAERYGGRANESEREKKERIAYGPFGVGQADTKRGRREQRDTGQRTIPEFNESSELDIPPEGRWQGFRNQSAHKKSLQTSPWESSYWLQCKDGKLRPVPVEPAFFPLVDGSAPGRVGLLRGAGDAIVAQVAQAFIESAMEVLGG